MITLKGNGNTDLDQGKGPTSGINRARGVEVEKNLLGAVQDENLKGNLDRDPEIRNDNLLFFILYLKNNKLIDNI